MLLSYHFNSHHSTGGAMKRCQSLLHVLIITTHVCDVSGVIVLTSSMCLSVCVCVCVLPLSRLSGETYRLDFRYIGQVEGYLGQV